MLPIPNRKPNDTWKMGVDTLEKGWFIRDLDFNQIAKLETVNTIDGSKLKANQAFEKLSETEKQNARLICAAPQMAACLEALYEAFSDKQSDLNEKETRHKILIKIADVLPFGKIGQERASTHA